MTKAETRLKASRAALVAELTEIEHDLDAPPPKDWEDRASERQGDDVLEALGHRDRVTLRQVDAALDRIADGSYGLCVACGARVSAKRLAVLPATPFCVACASWALADHPRAAAGGDE